MTPETRVLLDTLLRHASGMIEALRQWVRITTEVDAPTPKR